jgi:hypothetical protein
VSVCGFASSQLNLPTKFAAQISHSILPGAGVGEAGWTLRKTCRANRGSAVPDSAGDCGGSTPPGAQGGEGGGGGWAPAAEQTCLLR